MNTLNPLPQELTIYAVSELRSAWLDWLTALPEGTAESAVQLDAAAVDTVDAAGLQLLVALRRSLQAQGWRLSVTPASTALREACSVLGMRAACGVEDAAAEVTP